MAKNKKVDRRKFIENGFRVAMGLAIAGIGGITLTHSSSKNRVWQIDPFKCTQCGRCADYCVLEPSAVKCVHAFDLCGYCDLCGGYFKPDANELETGAENQLCPTAAIKRKFI